MGTFSIYWEKIVYGYSPVKADSFDEAALKFDAKPNSFAHCEVSKGIECEYSHNPVRILTEGGDQ